MKRFFILALIISCSTHTYADKNVYEAKYTDGAAAITVDGNFDDWEHIGASREALGNYVSISNGIVTPVGVPSPDNLSAWFMCAADNKGVYIAIHVTDDVVVTDNQGFPNGWRDDIVEVCFDGDLNDIGKTGLDANDGQIAVVGGKDGLRWLAGIIPGLTAQVPYYWEARGVRAGYRQVPGGYSVEVMIPADVLGYESISGGTRIGMNVRVIENDDAAAGANGMLQGILGLAYDPKNVGDSRTEPDNQILFVSEMDSTASAAPGGETAAVSLGERELLVNVGLTDANRNETVRVMKELSEKMFARDWNGAVEAISPVKDQLWAKCITVFLSLYLKDYKNGARLLDEFVKSAGDKAIAEWAYYCPQENLVYYSGGNPVDVACLLNEYLRINPADTIMKEKLMYSLVTINKSDDVTLNTLGMLYQDAVTQDIADQSKLALARAYFYGENYVMAKNVANELIASCKDREIMLGARMVLMSIDVRIEGKK